MFAGMYTSLCSTVSSGYHGDKWHWMQAANEVEAGSGAELEQVEEQMAALDGELAKHGGTQAPASMPCSVHTAVA